MPKKKRSSRGHSPADTTLQEISVIVAGRHALTVAGTVALCERLPEVIVLGCSHTGTEGLALIEERAPVVAVIDILLDDLDGITLAAWLHERDIPTRVVLLADHADREWFESSLSIPSVGGYLLRSSSEEELVLAIRQAAAGQFYCASALQRRLIRVANDGVSARPRRQSKPRDRASSHPLAQARFLVVLIALGMRKLWKSFSSMPQLQSIPLGPDPEIPARKETFACSAFRPDELHLPSEKWGVQKESHLCWSRSSRPPSPYLETLARV